jgi:WD40 repeat protein
MTSTFDSTGAYFASVSADNRLRIWNRVSLLPCRYPFHRETHSHLARGGSDPGLAVVAAMSHPRPRPITRLHVRAAVAIAASVAVRFG